MSRLAFQRQWAKGSIVNIGAGDDPAGFGATATHVDLDVWKHPNFVQSNCVELPFADKSFDTAVLGDVLEHCVDPLRAVVEAARVAHRLIITVPEEMTLPSVGCHVERGMIDRAALYRIEHGRDVEGMTDEEVLVFHKRTDPRFVSAFPESVEPHDGHIWRFDEAWIDQFISVSGMKMVERMKVPECHWMNWLVVVED